MIRRNIINNQKNDIIFKSSDYDLDKDERKIRYKDYNNILCEKCNQKINRDWHCKKCYINETEEEKYRMLHGRCKGCSQIMKIRHWCSSCNSNRFQQDFGNWTSGNKEIDKLIQDNQTSACSNHVLEWIPYDKFTNINYLDSGGFAKVCSATWRDGRIEKWDQESNKWKRSGSFKVALKILNNSTDISEDFLNELRFLNKFPTSYYMYIIECYGITQDLHSNNYALVLKLKDCSLRSFLDKNYNSLTLKDKLYIIERICLGLDCIHNHNIIHRDLHLGNILYSINDKKRIEISISDFGFCKPAYENSSVPGKKIYGVMPYMAPEIWNGKEYTKESDIYSFGIIINEILSGSRPYQNVPHNINLALNICYGDRPNIRNGTPEPLKKLIQKCWDADIKNRPNTNQIYNMLRDFMYKKKDQGSYNFKEHTELYEKLQGSSHNMNDGTDGEVIMKDPPSKPQIFFSQAKYKSKFLNLPNLPAPVNSKSFMILKSDAKYLSVPKEHSGCSDCKIIFEDLKDLDLKIIMHK